MCIPRLGMISSLPDFAAMAVTRYSPDSSRESCALGNALGRFVDRVNRAEIDEYQRIAALHLGAAPNQGNCRVDHLAKPQGGTAHGTSVSTTARQYALIRAARSYRVVSAVLRGIKHPGRASLIAPFAALRAITQGAPRTLQLRAQHERALSAMAPNEQDAALARLRAGAAFRIARWLSPRLDRAEPRRVAASVGSRSGSASAR